MKPIYDIATFTDTNTGLSPSMYQATIDWGDGNESQGIITAGTSGFVVTSSNVFATAGTLTLTVTITDPSGVTVSQTGSISVEGIVVTPQTINQDADVPYSGLVGTFTDTSSTTDTYTAYVNFGGGGGGDSWVTATVQQSSTSGTYDVFATNTSNAQGSYTPSIVINGSGGMTDPEIITPDPNAVAPPSTPTYTYSSDYSSVTLTWVNTATNSTNVVIEECNETPNFYGFPTDENLHIQYSLDAYVTSQVIAVTPGGEYLFDVGAIGIGEAGYSGVIDLKIPMPSAPAQPDAPTVTGSGGTYYLTWDAVSGVDYELQYQETSNTLIGNTGWNENYYAADPTGTEVALTAGQSYAFRLIAFVMSGSTQVTSAPGATVPVSYAPPSSMPTPDFNVQWDTADSSDVDVTLALATPPAGYSDYPGIYNDGVFTLLQNGVIVDPPHGALANADDMYGSGTYTFPETDIGIDANMDLPFTIEFNQLFENTSTSVVVMSPAVAIDMPAQPGTTTPTESPVAGTPAPPTNLTATMIDSGDVNLVWYDMSNDETGFNIYRTDTSTAPTSGTTPLASTNWDSPVKKLPQTLNVGQKYYYWVTAINTNAPPGSQESSPVMLAFTVPPPPIIIGFWGLDFPFSDLPGGHLQDPNALFKADVETAEKTLGSPMKVFPENQEQAALSWLLHQLDTNGDGKYDPSTDVPRTIEIAGYSWGGWSAIKLAQDIKKSKYFVDKSIALLATVDPVDILKGNPGPVPSNVQTFWNRYESDGNFFLGVSLLGFPLGVTVNGYNPASNAGNSGDPNASQDVDPDGKHDLPGTRDPINHILIMDDYESANLISILENP